MPIIYLLLIVSIIILTIEMIISWSVHKDMSGGEVGDKIKEYSTFEEFKTYFNQYYSEWQLYKRWPDSLFINRYNPFLNCVGEIHASRYIINGKVYKFRFIDYWRVRLFIRNYKNKNEEMLLSNRVNRLRGFYNE